MQQSSLIDIILAAPDIREKLESIAFDQPDIGPAFDDAIAEVWRTKGITICVCFRRRQALNSRFVLHCLAKGCTATLHLCYEVPECLASGHRCLCWIYLAFNRTPIFYCIAAKHGCGCWSSYSVCHQHKDNLHYLQRTFIGTKPRSRVDVAAQFNGIAISTMLRLLMLKKTELLYPSLPELAHNLGSDQ